MDWQRRDEHPPADFPLIDLHRAQLGLHFRRNGDAVLPLVLDEGRVVLSDGIIIRQQKPAGLVQDLRPGFRNS